MTTRARLRVVGSAAALALAACQPAPPNPFGTDPVPEPALFAPEATATGEREYAITFGPDGTEAYFTRGGGGRGAEPPRIFATRFLEGAWTEAEPASFTEYRDETPSLSPDGSELYYSARRDPPWWGPGEPNNNLFFVRRIEGGSWSRPIPVAGDVNRPRLTDDDPARSELGPLLLPSGELLYSTTEDGEWGADLYVADRDGDGFIDPRPLRVSSQGAETHPAVSRDGRWLVFQAFRQADAVGEQDLYVSERVGLGWGRPRPLPEPVNSPDNDGYPSFSPDGRYLFFASDRDGGAGSWDIYFVEVEAAGLERGGP
jgi:dipeptidyl aminopeptidase/acylaminoacyl peptidase